LKSAGRVMKNLKKDLEERIPFVKKSAKVNFAALKKILE
jgi:hypothetical protein